MHIKCSYESDSVKKEKVLKYRRFLLNNIKIIAYAGKGGEARGLENRYDPWECSSASVTGAHRSSSVSFV